MIEIKNLCFAHKGKKIINNFSLSIKKKEKWVITGPSGCGKTTLLKILIGLLEIESGSISIDSTELIAQNLKEIRKKIGYIDQSSISNERNIFQYVNEIIQFKNNKKLKIKPKEWQKEILKFEIKKEQFLTPIKNLSGGEKQKLMMAILFILNRKIWILDEVSSSLDKKNSEQLASKLLQMPVTAIIVSHDPVWIKNPLFHHLNLGEEIC